MTPCFIDSGFLYALVDSTDAHSVSVKNSLQDIYEEVIFPTPGITEVSHFVAKNLGYGAPADFISDLPEMRLTLESSTNADLTRTAEILRKYNDSKIDFVDACIVAMAERLNITKILTVDRRHFQIFRPTHCEAFEIFP